MPSAFDILGLVLGSVSISGLLKVALRFIAAYLPSGREQEIEKTLRKTRARLDWLAHNGYLNDEGLTKSQEADAISKRLDHLSFDIERWEEKGITRFLDFSACMALLRRCGALEASVANLRTLLRDVPEMVLPHTTDSSSRELHSGAHASGVTDSQAASELQSRMSHTPTTMARHSPPSLPYDPVPQAQTWSTWQSVPRFPPSPPPSPDIGTSRRAQ